MSELLLFTLASIGWERLVRMLNCYQCAGFWSGLLTGLILLLGRWVPYLHLLLYGFAASFLGPLGAVFLGYLNAQSSAATGSARSEPEQDAVLDQPALASRNGAQEITADMV